MMFKKIVSVLIIVFLLFSIPMSVFANEKEYNFTLFGINFKEIWNYISFWDKKEEKFDINNVKIVDKQNNLNKRQSQIKPLNYEKKEVQVVIGNQIYTKSSIMNSINGKEEFKEYIMGFNYDCISIKTDKGAKLSLYFDVNSGKVTNMKNTISCDKGIYIEESLIKDIKTNGFEGKKIKSYLERVDLPTSMYFKAVKVFTIG